MLKWAIATSVRGVPYTAAHLGSILNFAMQASCARFKKEPKYAAVKVTPLTEVVLDLRLFGMTLEYHRYCTYVIVFVLYRCAFAKTKSEFFKTIYILNGSIPQLQLLPAVQLHFSLQFKSYVYQLCLVATH